MKKIALTYPLVRYTDLYKYWMETDLTDELARRELFLKMLEDMPHTCNLFKHPDGKFTNINGHIFPKIDLSNLELKNIGIANCEINGFNFDGTTIRESYFIHGRINFSGKFNLEKVSMIGDFNFGQDARVFDSVFIHNSYVCKSSIKVIRNSKLDNVLFVLDSEVKRFENCDMTKVYCEDRSLYKRTFNCVNVPQVYKINESIEIIAYGNKEYYINILNKISGRIDLGSTKSIVYQAGERIERVYNQYKSLFEAIDFDRVKFEYDDTYILVDELKE